MGTMVMATAGMQSALQYQRNARRGRGKRAGMTFPGKHLCVRTVSGPEEYGHKDCMTVSLRKGRRNLAELFSQIEPAARHP